MSRIGKKPIAVPKAVKMGINELHVKVTGPKGTLERDIRPEVNVIIDDSIVSVTPNDKSKRTDAFCGLTRSLLNNMITGVNQGFQKKLIIEGVGYRCEIENSMLTLNVGYSNPVQFLLPDGVSASVDKKSNTITLDCIDIELLGLTAARIRGVRKPEPYKGKGIRYEDERIIRKVGKSAGKK